MWSDGYIQNHYKHVYHIQRVSIQSNVSVSGFLMGVFCTVIIGSTVWMEHNAYNPLLENFCVQ